MNIDLIKEYINRYKKEDKRIFATSSFQTQSVVLLHILSRIDKSIPIYFINTGYHFPDTIRYRDYIVEKFGLNLFDVKPFVPKLLQKDRTSGNLLFTSDPDYCCYLNKIQPLEQVLERMDVWINGIRADQSTTRKEMKTEELTPNGTLRFHPMLDWTNKMIYQYINKHSLPKNPLEKKGYLSIGCEPCTIKFFANENIRSGRWHGMSKTECGLHTDLVKKKYAGNVT